MTTENGAKKSVLRPESSSKLSAGANTFQIPVCMYKENREKLCASFGMDRGIVFLVGGELQFKYDTDSELVFRQESFFRYLFGVVEPGWFGAVDIQSRQCTLFMPRLPAEYAVWEGQILSPEYFLRKYEVEQVLYVDEIRSFFKKASPITIHTLRGRNTDSGQVCREASFEGVSDYTVDTSVLYDHLVECRVIKSEKELQLLKWVNLVASEAHRQVMRKCKPGMMEYQLESVFLHESYHEGGHRFTAYTCVCGAGHASSTLHYHANDKQTKDGDIAMFDMGGEYFGYASDISCSFPVNGKFSRDQKTIYNAVLSSQKAVMEVMRPGVSWPQMHRLAERVILRELIKGGLLCGSVEEMEAVHLCSFFMPHGLGHFMGLDVHDVGGYPRGQMRSTEPGLKNLRFGGVLRKGMVLTVEPGVYFIDVLLDQALSDAKYSKFLVKDVLSRFRGFGGIRIEDDVIVTENGIENMTKCPRTVEEIEKLMAEEYILK
eukprot:Sdes_comp18615_c0_seq1m8787